MFLLITVEKFKGRINLKTQPKISQLVLTRTGIFTSGEIAENGANEWLTAVFNLTNI